MAFIETSTPKRWFWGGLVEPHQAKDGMARGKQTQLAVSLVLDTGAALKAGTESLFDCNKESHG